MLKRSSRDEGLYSSMKDDRPSRNSGLWGEKDMDDECTSFMRMRHVNHRKEPKAHSRARREGPKIRWSRGLISGPSSMERRARMGNHMSPESQRSGSVVGTSRKTRERTFTRSREHSGSMSYARQPFQMWARDRTLLHRQNLARRPVVSSQRGWVQKWWWE